jgi:hypothetical protein
MGHIKPPPIPDGMQCQYWTAPGTISARASAWQAHPHQCVRRATYTNGRSLYCTQHAKQPATVLRMATGQIQAGMIRLDTPEGQTLLAKLKEA